MVKGSDEAGEGSNSSQIRTFLRIRPSKRPSGYLHVDEFDKSRLGFHVPIDTKDGEYVNNTRTSHKFKFDGVLGEKATQEDVFAKIGKGAVFNVLDGYNSTVFAYGQTGSGKTFTVTGGAERYVDRGIIPRALSLLFAEFKERSDQQFTCHISYLEIYNEQGFDLLDPSHDSKKLEDLAKVSLMEDEDGNIHLRNLSVYLAANEEEALNYLFLGDTNRAISETAMNKASSRSHCIFTISVEGRKHGSEKVMRSKLHLVDLAGSERVHKTQTGGQTLVEAKHINVSLFFLEMVIVALRERGGKGRQHIPYRNSMMTSVLRDSLGGNCKTVMIATVNSEAAQTEESMSTCRFAQRVSTIKNNARINEDVDPVVLIRRLKSDCAALADEVAFLKGEAGDGEELTSEEAEDLARRCRTFVEDRAPNAQLSIGSYTLTKLKRCFSVLKAMVLDGRQASGSDSRGEGMQVQRPPLCGEGEYSTTGVRQSWTANGAGELGGQLLSLRDALRQRDNEIAILVNMLKQGKCHACATRDPSSNQTAAAATTPPAATAREGEVGAVTPNPHRYRGTTSGHTKANRTTTTACVGGQAGGLTAGAVGRGREAVLVAPPPDASVLGNHQKAFAYFREKHPGQEALEENKTLLGEKYSRAKAMGERVNQARSTIQYLKNTIEQVRRERALDGLMEEGSVGADEIEEGSRRGDRDDEDEEEAKWKAAIEVEKRVYKTSFQELRELKSEIEHIQRLLEKSRAKMQTDFQAWYEPLMDTADAAADGPDRGVAVTTIAPAGEAQHRSTHNTKVGPLNDPANHSTEALERQTSAPFDGGGSIGNSTPTRRPPPPVDAWGTPPTSGDRRDSFRAGFASGKGGVASLERASDRGPRSGANEGGLLPPLTGNKEADDDIAAFYRAKEELDRRKAAAAGRVGAC